MTIKNEHQKYTCYNEIEACARRNFDTLQVQQLMQWVGWGGGFLDLKARPVGPCNA